MSLNPDDFLIGLHFKAGAPAENLRLVPSVEAGFGDLTWVAGNLDLHYVFQGKVAPYAGGGVTLNWFDTGDGNLEFGGGLLGGLQLSKKIFFEAKLGLGDVPDWKLVVGFGR